MVGIPPTQNSIEIIRNIIKNLWELVEGLICHLLAVILIYEFETANISLDHHKFWIRVLSEDSFSLPLKIRANPKMSERIYVGGKNLFSLQERM